nr:MAG TPA: peptidase [Microviridae sp.]
MLHEYSLFNQGTQQVSEHFKIQEFAQKDYRCDKILIESELIKVLEDIRTHFNKPVIITSGYRTPEYNKKVGGVKNSQHTKGTAADIKVKNVLASKVQNYLSKKYPNKYGIGRYNNFTHIDVRKKKARWRG